MSSICKNCGISAPAQTSKCFPHEVENETRHEFLPPPAPAQGIHRVPVNFIEPSHIFHICILFAFNEIHLLR
jgi:hypothetical protein